MAHQPASSAGPAKRSSSRVAQKTAEHDARATPDGDGAAACLWHELKGAFPALRSAHFSAPLLLAAKAAVKQGVGKERSGQLPDAERAALRALLPAGGRVDKLRVWSSYLHRLNAQRAAAGTVASVARDGHLGPRVAAQRARAHDAILADLVWELDPLDADATPSGTGPPLPHPVVWRIATDYRTRVADKLPPKICHV